jgi:hypothetical protein
MTDPDDLNAILDRIAAGIGTESDIATLQQALIVSSDRNVVQLEKYNLNINQGQDIQVGDRHYYGPNTEAIQVIIRNLLDEYTGSKNAEIENKGSSYVSEIQQIPCIYNTLYLVHKRKK